MVEQKTENLWVSGSNPLLDIKLYKMQNLQIKIQFKAFNYKLLDKTIYKISQKGLSLQLNCTNPVSLPTKKHLFTVLKSPHVNKKARDQFQLITHKRLIILNFNELELENVKLFLDYIKSLSSGIEIKINYLTNLNWNKI